MSYEDEIDAWQRRSIKALEALPDVMSPDDAYRLFPPGMSPLQKAAELRKRIASKLEALPDGSLDLGGYFTSAPRSMFGREFEMAAERQIHIFGVRIPTRKLTPEFVTQLARGAQMTPEGAERWQRMLYGEAINSRSKIQKYADEVLTQTEVAPFRRELYGEWTNTEGESVNSEVAVYEPTPDEMLGLEVAARRKVAADAERETEYARKLALYESFGEDREDGAVVSFSKQFEGSDIVYTYASRRANGKWYTTGGGSRTPQHYTWPSFVLWLVTGIPAENFFDMFPVDTRTGLDVNKDSKPWRIDGQYGERTGNLTEATPDLPAERKAPLTDALRRSKAQSWPAAGAANIDDASDDASEQG